MTKKSNLNPEILDYLHRELNKPISTIRKDISILKRRFTGATSNAVAQIYAEQHGASVRRLIKKEDKLSIPFVAVEKPTVLKSKKRVSANDKIKIVLEFDTTNVFLKKHINEINKAYTKNCYTCVFILVRKVFENLIIEIMKAKYPTSRDLYFDAKMLRNLDFSVVLENLYIKRNEFDSDKKEAIDRLNQKLKPFKNDANDKVHSLFHIVENKTEVDDWNLDTIMALIKRIMQ